MAPKFKVDRKRLLLFGAIALALVVIVILTLPVVSTLHPDYYRRYPGLSERMDHWAVSTHSRISCVDCHMEPGVRGFISYGARSFPAFYSQLFNGASSTNLLGAPSTEACMKCHTTYRTVAPSGDLLIPHKAHVSVLKMNCADCHKDLVHSENRRGFNRPEMEGCLEQCHDGDTASNECIDCHTSKATPASHEAKDWMQVHGAMSEKVDCAECHDWTPDYCSDCHKKRPASHAGNWKKGHAPHAKIRGDGCLVCHEEKFCKECH
ncbi:MAG TPA: cytochrome c3 family protein [Coriobacteriia bacterium]|nr:cytochrome c3 family protein [Coriobacteriia bacterium]